LPDLRLVTAPPRDELLDLLRARLSDVVPGLRLLARGLRGAAESPIDFVGVEPSGRAVLVLVGGADEDLELIGRALAQRVWAEARLGDWLQLAPESGIRPEAGLLVQLLCPSFRHEARLAARALGPERVALGTVRFVRGALGIEPLLERIIDDTPARRAGDGAAPLAEAPPLEDFRTGLDDAQLGLTEAELAEFE
jgi:hypothetical protein